MTIPLCDMVDAFAAWLRPLEPGDRPHTPDTPHTREIREFVYCAIHRGIVPLGETRQDADSRLYICRRCEGQREKF